MSYHYQCPHGLEGDVLPCPFVSAVEKLRARVKELERRLGPSAQCSEEELVDAWQYWLELRKRIRQSDDKEEKDRLMAEAMQHARKYNINPDRRKIEGLERECERLQERVAVRKMVIDDALVSQLELARERDTLRRELEEARGGHWTKDPQ